MTILDKINNLFEKIKSCPDADIQLHMEPLIPLFLALSKADRNEFVASFCNWVKENVSEKSLKFVYGEYFLGTSSTLNEDYEKALPLLTRARKSFEELGDSDGEEMSSLVTGVLYRSLGNFDLAIKTLVKPFEYFKRTGHHPILFEGSCNSLANVNFELRNYDDAFSIFNAGYEASLKSGNYYFRIYALDGMGRIRMMQDEHAEAKEYFNRALEEAEKMKSPLHISNALTELAVFDFRIGNLAEAEHLNLKALAIRQQEKLTGAAVTNSINLGEIYIRQSKWNEALDVLSKAREMAEQMKVKPKIYQVHMLLSQAYKGIGNMEQSLHHYELFHELREKVQQEDNARKLSDAKMIFEAEQTRKENIIIKKQKQEIEIKNRQLQETIDELTITKVSRKAKGITLIVGIALIIAEEPIFHYVLRYISEENLFLSIAAKVVVILCLKPIDKAIEGYLLHRLVLKRRRNALEKNRNDVETPSTILEANK